MAEQADIVSHSRMVDSIKTVLPKLHARARLESAENEGVRDLLRDIEKAIAEMQKDPERPGVMVTARDKTSSMLQTFLAQRAQQAGTVEPGVDLILDIDLKLREQPSVAGEVLVLRPAPIGH
jgi:hypothetical protein